jgi:hypothetical protein
MGTHTSFLLRPRLLSSALDPPFLHLAGLEDQRIQALADQEFDRGRCPGADEGRQGLPADDGRAYKEGQR